MDLVSLLGAAGLTLVEETEDRVLLIPPIITGQAPSCPVGERFAELDIDLGDPALVQSVNKGWYRMSVEAGLFSEIDRQFLLAFSPSEEVPARWIRVELQSQWDILSEYAPGLLGSGRCRPEFRMLSLNGSVLSCGTTGESSISIFVLKEPSRSPTFRKFAEWVVASEFPHPLDVAAVRRWLTDTRESKV
jgi:hypothetical protein